MLLATLLLLSVIGPTTTISYGGEATRPVGDGARLLLTKTIAPGRELIALQRDVDETMLPELFASAAPLEPGHRVVPPTRITLVTFLLRDGPRTIPLFCRLVQEYEPNMVGYEVIDMRFENGGKLIILAWEPANEFSLTRVFPTTGACRVAWLNKAQWLSQGAAPISIKHAPQARITGSTASSNLGIEVSVAGVQGNTDETATPRRFLIDESANTFEAGGK